MISTLNNAISGLRAAELRIANSANNVANLHSTTSLKDGVVVNEAFKPQRVMQQSIEPTGGVKASLIGKNPATVSVYDPDNVAADAEGVTQYPNVDLAEELVDQKFATYDFKANLKVIQREQDMNDALMDATRRKKVDIKA